MHMQKRKEVLWLYTEVCGQSLFDQGIEYECTEMSSIKILYETYMMAEI